MTATSGDKVWESHEISTLIGLYEGHPCLYNVKLKEYKDRDKKKAALREIATALETTEAEVTKKLNSLRSQYNRERAKLVSGAKSGSGIEDAQKSKVTWVHFESLQFLRDFDTPKRSRSNVQQTENSQADQEIEQFDEADEEAEMTGKEDDLVNYNIDEDADSDIDMESQANAVTKKKSTKRPLPLLKDCKKPAKGKRREDEESQMFKRAVSVMETAVASQSRPSSAQDADEIFGQYIVAELKTIKDQYVNKMVKLKIQNLIFETEFSSFASVNNPVLPLQVIPHSMRPSGVQGYPSNFRLPSDQKMPSMLPSSGQAFSGTFRLPSDKTESSSSLQNLVLVAPENCAPVCSQPSRAINPSPVGSEEPSLSNLSDSASQFSLP